jgi:nucleoside-triphosphatase THEP1
MRPLKLDSLLEDLETKGPNQAAGFAADSVASTRAGKKAGSTVADLRAKKLSTLADVQAKKAGAKPGTKLHPRDYL